MCSFGFAYNARFGQHILFVRFQRGFPGWIEVWLRRKVTPKPLEKKSQPLPGRGQNRMRYFEVHIRVSSYTADFIASRPLSYACTQNENSCCMHMTSQNLHRERWRLQSLPQIRSLSYRTVSFKESRTAWSPNLGDLFTTLLFRAILSSHFIFQSSPQLNQIIMKEQLNILGFWI